MDVVLFFVLSVILSYLLIRLNKKKIDEYVDNEMYLFSKQKELEKKDNPLKK